MKPARCFSSWSVSSKGSTVQRFPASSQLRLQVCRQFEAQSTIQPQESLSYQLQKVYVEHVIKGQLRQAKQNKATNNPEDDKQGQTAAVRTRSRPEECLSAWHVLQLQPGQP